MSWDNLKKLPRGTYSCDLRRFGYKAARFYPSGPIYCEGVDPPRLNPVKRQEVVPLTARLFVGLNVGAEPTFTVDDVVKIVRRVRTEQGEAPDSSFLLQRGLYTGRTNETVEEDTTHAIKMLKQSERRLKIAKTVHRRWVAKVNYYERAAAKRGK